MPIAADSARAAATGASTISGAGRPTGSQPDSLAHSAAQPASATAQARAAHSRRHDRPMINGSPAASRNAPPSGGAPYGPVSNRSSSGSDSDPAVVVRMPANASQPAD